ncbi:MAG: GAF domain-containing protein, partial [Halothece sp. Uz-M2-17]|nr:GAF domain-containing protein [Halothece sp. Uz-M2-17]
MNPQARTKTTTKTQPKPEIETPQINTEEIFTRLANQILQTKDLDDIFRETTDELRDILECDRVAIYQFNEDWTGQFIADSADSQWSSLLNLQQQYPKIVDNVNACSVRDLAEIPLRDTHLYQTNGGAFNRGERYRIVNDIYEKGFSKCYLQVLETYQARAYLIVAIYHQGKLWGLLAAYQNDAPRQWQESEVQLLTKVGTLFGIAIQQFGYIQQIEARTEALETNANQEKALNKIVDRIRQSQDLDAVFNVTTSEIRQLLSCDRVAIYQFNENWGGEFISESVDSKWVSVIQEQRNSPEIVDNINACSVRDLGGNTDTHLQQTRGGRFSRGEVYRVCDDIYNKNYSECYIRVLESYQAKAYVVVAIYQGSTLWGLLAAYQNDSPRKWQDEEVQLLVRIANQFSIAVQQSDYIQQVKASNDELQKRIEREQTLSKTIDRIRQSLGVQDLFETTVRQIRRFMKADRVGVFRFYPDSGYDDGEFVAEDVVAGYPSAIAAKVHDHCFGNQYADKYADGHIQAVADIYNAELSSCHIDILSQFEVRANLIVPLLVGGNLWGLLCVHQCSEPRNWKEEEIQFIQQVASQFGVALQQSEYLRQLETSRQQLDEKARRESAIVQFSARLVNRFSELVQQNIQPQSLLQFATDEMRRILKADRVGVYRFNEDWSGEFIVESVGADWPKLVGTELAKVQDTYLQENKGGRYANKESLRVEDIYTVGHSECHVELLETWGTRSYAIAPIFKGDMIWGLLGVYQNSHPRHWEDSEMALLEQVGIQIGITFKLSDNFVQLREQETQLQTAAEREKTEREKLQKGALRILRAIEPSFRGDLTVRAPLSEDEMGTIADGYNTTIQSLRELVRRVKEVSSRVSATSENSQTKVEELSTRARTQADQLESAIAQLQKTMESTEAVTTDAQKVEQAVQEANRIVQTGDSQMERTVDGISEIRDTVSETAKKIKRLGEASQKISKVVSVIDNFATQTNLLALNASIEATRAGEYGKGFAVVADEVRSLAYQSAEATTEIEQLVEEIQGGTNEVTEAMEVGIAQVVQGTELVNETRDSLSAIVSATSKI